MQLDHIIKKYPHLQVEIPHLKIPESDIVLILGESGCGKSTFLHIVSGFLDVDSGSITHEKKTALMLQNPMNQVIMSSVMDELSFPQKNAGKDKQEQIRAVTELAVLCDVEHLLHRKMTTLSFGETQWIMLLATLLSPASIFCLDEPTSHLDPLSVEKFYKMLKIMKNKGCGCLITSQHPDEYIFADRIWIMNNGKIIQDLSPEDFLSYAAGRDCEPDQIRIRELVAMMESGKSQ